MCQRPTKPISPNADRQATVDLETPECSREGTSDALPRAKGDGSCLDIEIPNGPGRIVRSAACDGHSPLTGDEQSRHLSQLAAPYVFLLGYDMVHQALVKVHAPLVRKDSRRSL